MKFSTPRSLALWLSPLLLAACSSDAIDMQTHYISDRATEWNTPTRTRSTRRPGYYGAVPPKTTPLSQEYRRPPQPAPVANVRVAPEPHAAARPTPKPAAPLPAPAVRHDTPARQSARQDGYSTYPTAKRAFQQGYVISPYTGAKIPVGKVPHGAKVLDPSSEKVFINP